MMALLTITRRLLGETRWSLTVSMLAFFGLAMLWNWGISTYQFPPQHPDPNTTVGEAGPDEGASRDVADRDRRRGRAPSARIYVFFGVPAEEILGVDRAEAPTLAMQVAIGNHPLVFLAVLGWAISRASAAVAGEIERGTLDLTLSRPVRRSTYLAAQVLETVIVFVLLGLVLAAGHLASSFVFRLNAPPGPLEYGPMIAAVAALGLAVFGYTLPVSSGDLSRARAGIIGLGLTLAGIAALIFAQQYEQYDWVARASVFEYHGPVGLTLEPDRERLIDLATLLGVFAVGSAVSFVVFQRRDLPSNSG